MPLYLCVSKTGSIPDDVKEGIATSFTDIHTGLTFAPRSFVHVYFLENDDSLDDSDDPGPIAFISGNIRADRSDDTKDEIVNRMRSSLAATLGCDLDNVQMSISETPANWTMEGGHLLPAPGEEDAWMERHEAMQAAETLS